MSVLDMTSTLERDIFTTVSMAFDETFIATRTYWQDASTVIPVNSRTIRFPFRGMTGSLKKFVDERQLEKIRALEFSGTVIKWEKTIEIDRDDIDDDNLGLLGFRGRDLGIATAQHPDELLWEDINLIISGVAGTEMGNGFDGQRLFSKTHAWAGVSGTQENLIEGETNASMNLTNAHNSIQNAITVMKGFTGDAKDKSGNPKRLGVKPNLLMVASNIYFDVKRQMTSANMQVSTGATSTTIDRGTDNVLVDEGIRLIENPYLTDNYWIMMDTTQAMRAIIFLDRAPVEFGSQTSNESDDVFMREKFKQGVRARYSFIPGFWFFALAGDGETS